MLYIGDLAGSRSCHYSFSPNFVFIIICWCITYSRYSQCEHKHVSAADLEDARC